jgi:3'-5' exoribonuclease
MSIREAYLVTEMTTAQTKRGSNYARCKLVDARGSIAAKMWDYDRRDLGGQDFLKSGSYVYIEGVVEDYQGHADVKISRCLHPGPVDVTLFERRSQYDENEMWERIGFHISTMHSPWFRNVAKDIFEQGDYAARFRDSAAATYYHHAFKHGLLEHTLEMIEVGQTLLSLPFFKNRLCHDLCIFGLLMHDFGKIFEYDTTAGYPTTRTGLLVPHIPLGAAMIYEACKRLGVPPVVREYMMHVVLAHHRELEFGSPVTFACPEAAFVHYVDNLHGDVFGMLQKTAESKDPLTKLGKYRLVTKSFTDILTDLEGEAETDASLSEQAAQVDGF